LLNSILKESITLDTFLICTGVSIILGLCTAFIGMFKNKASQSFALTIAVLPAVVQMVIMLVNGNIGAGVAVAGAFSLIRFRSAAGSAREIVMIFLSMTIGLACGMGYVVLAVFFFIIIAVYLMILNLTSFGKADRSKRELKITIPENLDYDGIFDDIFRKYTYNSDLVRVKTTNMGTLYELVYHITVKNDSVSKAFLDEIRCRNGNLTISCGHIPEKAAL